VDERTVQVRFTVLEFRHANTNRFRYRVDGRDWVETSDRNLNLEQLQAGRHRVEVKAGNPEAGWSDEVQTLEFDVAPRWYELWWIRVLVSVLSLLMVLLIWRMRNRRLETARKALERAVEIRTEQLRLEKQKVEEQHTQIGQLLERAIESNRLKS
jgi:membrane protein implicated in regulation of membrane protease activity